MTLSVAIYETLKWLSSLPILIHESFWWWQCSDWYIISRFPHLHTPPPFFPSLRSFMVSVDVKHHVYLLTCFPQSNPPETAVTTTDNGIYPGRTWTTLQASAGQQNGEKQCSLPFFRAVFAQYAPEEPPLILLCRTNVNATTNVMIMGICKAPMYSTAQSAEQT